MKKSAFFSAVVTAATINTGAHAFVSSAINPAAIEAYTSGFQVEVDCASTWHSGYATGLALSGVGTGPGQINLFGVLCVDPSLGGMPYFAFVINATGGAVTTPLPGTEITGGTIDIYADSGAGWIYYNSISATALDCVADGFLVAGIQWAGGGTNTLPGAPSPTLYPVNAACDLVILGNYGLIYLTGTNSD